MSYSLVPRPPPFLPFIRVHNNTRKGKIKNGGGLGPRLSELHVGVSLGRVPIHKEYVFSVCTGGCPDASLDACLPAKYGRPTLPETTYLGDHIGC